MHTGVVRALPALWV